ncbi:MAG: hypothetical protein E3J60_03855 [Dehalococcoidia bacterium]|nr:MAG: hypothetical protein E3J60_03855 [Dehalococcoidia bacterium]
MSKEPIEMVKETIKNYADSQSRLESEIVGLRNKIEKAEKEVSQVKNIKQSFESALKYLEEANGKEA